MDPQWVKIIIKMFLIKRYKDIGPLMPKLTYSCTKCGTGHSKWSGQCDSCGSWNTLTDEGPLASGPSKTLGGKRGSLISR